MDFKDAVKTKNIIKISPDDIVASALGRLGSSHDSAFVFNDRDEFKGVINPYYCLIKKSYPGNAKVEHCIFHAPRVSNKLSVSKLAQLFIGSKLHYLPIFDERDKFIGIASARRLLTLYNNWPKYNISIESYLRSKRQRVLTIYDTDLVSTAIKIFKTKKISKLIMVGKDNKLKGILTYYDLISFLMTPRRKDHKGDRSGNKVNFQFQQVKNFAKTYVLTLTPQHTLMDALDLILKKEIGSIIIVNEKKIPLGIITTSDFLHLLIQGKEEKKIEISGRGLSEESQATLQGFFTSVSNWAKRLPNGEKVKLDVREEKAGGVFKTVLSIIPAKGPAKVITKEGKNLRKVLSKVRIKQK
ncbi:CBS domain-containing protein [Candidatus Microgenomates bacterium]|nr:CBS domain-containing protein [Candidatus Microgenomates bacterium]